MLASEAVRAVSHKGIPGSLPITDVTIVTVVTVGKQD